MTFAEGLAEKDGYTSIRLDAYTGHERTRRFYERRGYQVRAEVFFPQREMPFWCFERKVYNRSRMKIIAVCLGNICRSPLAEGLLRREAEALELDWEIASGGTAGYHTGNPPDPRSIAIARQHELDISGQRSHHVTVADLEYYDIILGMDRQNVEDLRARAETREQREKVHLFLEFAGLTETDGPDVFDPYYDDGAYAAVYELVGRSARATIARLVAK
jgi:protein-tyrosine phosphatase